MPAKVKVRILAGRNLPVMDKSSDASDAFVEVKLGNTTYKTEVYRRSLNPFWNSEWFRFEVSDQELQDEPLQIRIMDYDTYSANDAIGKVYINLNPLLLNPGRSMSGWLPIYDTLHGIRGEINCMVKVNLFADNNRYRHSSCGVRFFFSDIPNGYKCDAILGFVDELLVNDDPEYQWIDKIRTPRASNEARQTLFTKLSGEVQRKLGLKAEIFGGNAVIGYQQSFDLEGGSGIVGRGIGTAVVLSKIGFPYNGIISPLHASSQAFPPPYPYNNTSLTSQYYDRNTSFHKQRWQQDRRLVHSVSADYFYEVPADAINKKLSAAFENNRTSKNLKRMNNISFSSDNNSDSSLYEDCEETLSDSSTTITLSRDMSSYTNNNGASKQVEEIRSNSPKYNPFRSIRLLSSAHKNLTSTEDDAMKELSSYERPNIFLGRRKLSAGYFISKLSQTNDSLTKTLANVTKPTNAIFNPGLTKILPFRKVKHQQKQIRSTSSDSTNQRCHSPSKNDPNVITTTIQPTKKYLTKSISDSSQAQTSTISQHTSTSSNNSTSQSATTSGASSGAAGGQKWRRDKSQSASIEDALSIIEEKHDDDDHHSHPEKQNQNYDGEEKQNELDPEARIRLMSSSSAAKQRHMVRSKEIDLNDDHVMAPSGSITKPKAFSISSTEDDEPEDNLNSSATTLSSSTLNYAKSPKDQSESLLSSSTPSTSMLTDETVKAVKLNPETSPSKTKLTGSKSSYATMRRSDTDLTSSSKAHSPSTSVSIDRVEKKQGKGKSPYSINRSESSYTNAESISKNANPELKLNNSSRTQNNNFIQTVKTIKAEQKLLNNFIKQQNSNLGTGNKTKNMFTYPNRVHQSEYPFVTLKKFPEKMIYCTGGVVSVHSVKLLDHIINDEESETRDIWWTEIRKEIRSHAKALNCNTILGYSETSKVIGDVCVLSACGTAAILRDLIEGIDAHDPTDKQQHSAQHNQTLKVPRLSSSPPLICSSMPPGTINSVAGAVAFNSSSSSQLPINVDQTGDSHQKLADEKMNFSQQRHNGRDCGDNVDTDTDDMNEIDCSFCHTSLACLDSMSTSSICGVCKRSKVPDVLLLTIEPPKNLNIATSSTIIQARVCRTKRDSHGEASAKEIGEALPFLEYELHRQLFSKLKFKGFNCIFNLSFDVSVGENMLTAIATGTGCFVIGLPVPEPPQISAGKGIKASKLAEIQRLISMCAAKNREKLGLDQINAQLEFYHKKHGICPDVENDNLEPNSISDDGNQEFGNKLTVPGASFMQDSGSDVYVSGDNSGSKANVSSGRKILKHHHHHHHNKHHHHSRSRKTSQIYRDQRNISTPEENLISLVSDNNNIVLEVDDNEDADIIALLIDSDIPDGYLVCNSETIPSINQTSITSINMFTQVMRSKLTDVDKFAQQFDWIMQSLFVKLRRSLPCCLTHLNFIVDLPESHIVQISVTGCLLSLNASPDKLNAIGAPEASANNSLGQSSANNLDNKQDMNIQQTSSDRTTSTLASTSSISSSSSSSSSASPTSSSVSTLRSSSSTSSSLKSTKTAANTANNQQQQQQQQPTPSTSSSIQTKAGEQVKSITKKLSNSNIAALLTGNSTKNKQQPTKEIELLDRRQAQASPTQQGETTNATIAAVKQEIEQNRLGQKLIATTSGQLFKPVFKKQQTFPGANSPAISGQDRLIPPPSNQSAVAGDQATSLNNATRRATLILNKVKQPLKDLGSNFNTGSGAAGGSSSAEATLGGGQNKALSSRQGTTSKSRSAAAMVESSSKVKSTSSSAGNNAGTSNQLSCSPTIKSGAISSTQVMADSEPRSSSSINSSIDITSLSYIPGAKEYHYLGNLSFSFVRETNSVRENGGLNGFIHCFLMEVYAIVRAHVSALGGNAFLSFRLQQSCIFYHSNKNQAQCLISVAGDAVQVAI